MNKAELVQAVRERCEPDDFRLKASAARAVDAVFDVIQEQVAAGGEVGISGFGVFKAVEKAPRTGRNVRTGEAVAIPAKTVPVFKPGTGFKRDVAC